MVICEKREKHQESADAEDCDHACEEYDLRCVHERTASIAKSYCQIPVHTSGPWWTPLAPVPHQYPGSLIPIGLAVKRLGVLVGIC